jgi:hypothetical protein
MPELKLGYQGPLYNPWYDWAKKNYGSYSFLLGNRDGYFGGDEERFVKEMQRRLGIVIDGKFGDRTASAVGYKWPGTTVPPVVKARRKIWIYTFPGSGALGDVGPSHDLGERCKNVLNINHQWVRFQVGGYLGFMGGDPTFSYNDVIWDQYKSLEWLLDNNPDAQEAMRLAEQTCIQKQWDVDSLTDAQLIEIAKLLEFEHHLSGYSQSAQGAEEAAEMLYGDGGFVHPGDKTHTPSNPGRYRLIRHTLKLVVQFGNPSTAGTGIARKVRSLWLRKKIRNVNYDNDFYAKVPASDEIRPAMYAIIVEAEMELPFFVHVLKIAVPVILGIVPIFGGLFGPLGALAVAAATGLGAFTPLLGGLMGQASAGDEEVDRKLIDMLSITGLIKNLPGLIGLISALPGLQAHGNYPFDPFMMDQAYNHIAGFRR